MQIKTRGNLAVGLLILAASVVATPAAATDDPLCVRLDDPIVVDESWIDHWGQGHAFDVYRNGAGDVEFVAYFPAVSIIAQSTVVRGWMTCEELGHAFWCFAENWYLVDEFMRCMSG